MSLSVPNTGATAVEARRYAVITQDRLETSWNWRPMVGSAVATMVWSSAARNMVSIRLIRMVWTSRGVSAGGGAIGGASLSSMTSVVMRARSRAAACGNGCWSAVSRLWRSNLFIRALRINVLPLARNIGSRAYVAADSPLWQRAARMGASRERGATPLP